MKVKYIGPFDAVVVPDRAPGQSGRWVEVEKNGRLEVSDEYGKTLTAQTDNWIEIDSKKGGDK